MLRYTYDESKREMFAKIYDILIEHAGASSSPDEKESFVLAFTQIEYPTSEYRFQGKLGFGGKFRRGSGQFCVTCYPEDETPERKRIIAKVNDLLKG